MVHKFEPFKSWKLGDENSEVSKKYHPYTPQTSRDTKIYYKIARKYVKLNLGNEKLEDGWGGSNFPPTGIGLMHG